VTATHSEVVAFLLPRFDDPLQVGFLLVILGLMATTMLLAHLSARAASWERKWTRGTATTDDDLDIEHGSVTDLWHAVATGPEKLAEIMPGLLLVVGLLGTFLGLGMALNHASNILGQADAASDGLGDLLGLLKGLGTKFKTSTWGIMAFVAFRIWSELTRFEEKRLAWVIGKVKAELKARNDREHAAAEARQAAVLEQIARAGQTVVDGLGATLVASAREQQAATLAALGGIAASLAGVRDATQATSTSMAEFTRSTESIVGRMAEAAIGMANGASQVSASAQRLNDAVGTFGDRFEEVLSGVGTTLGSAIEQMSRESAATLKDGATGLRQAATDVANAMTTIANDLRATMGSVEASVNTSLDIQRAMGTKVEGTLHCLSQQVAATTVSTDTCTKEIQLGLKSVAHAARHATRISARLQAQEPYLKRIADHLGASHAARAAFDQATGMAAVPPPATVPPSGAALPPTPAAMI